VAERTAVLVVRVWVETASGAGLRARVTRTLDITARDEESTVVATPEEITRLVAEWLEAFVAERGDAVVTRK